MTLEEIIDTAPAFVKRMPEGMKLRWAKRQFEILNDPNRPARLQQEKDDADTLAAIKADAFVRNFISMTPQQVTDYVNANTGSLAQVRALMVKMSLMLLTLARREYR